MIAERTGEAVGLPPPSPELVLIRVFVEAYLATAHLKPRQRARAFLDTAATIMENEETVALVRPIRGVRDHAEVTKARREAVALFEALRPTLMARLPPE